MRFPNYSRIGVSGRESTFRSKPSPGGLMGNLRKEDSLLWAVTARQARAAWLASSLLAFTGCTAGPPPFTLPEEFVSKRSAPSSNGQAAADDGSTSKDKEAEQPAKEESPRSDRGGN